MISLIILTTIIVTIVFFINKEITILEYLYTVLIVNVITLIIYSLSLIPFPNDTYFASGRIMKTTYFPAWVEEYQQAHTICTSSGKSTSCTTYYTTEHDHHQPYWMMYDNLGQDWEIDSLSHAQIKSYFGNNVHISQPDKSTHGGDLISGDPNIYEYNNDTNIYKYPTTKLIKWYNPIKGSHSLFNERSGDFKRAYPVQTGTFSTDRLMSYVGTDMSIVDLDRLNTKIYESKQANFIVVQQDNFEDCNKLEAYWNGGNYNDLIACVSGKLGNPNNVKVIGYAEDPMIKRDLESLILSEGITKKSSNDIINLIQKQYVQFDFSQFKYIRKDCPLWVTILAVIASIVSSIYCIGYFSSNWDRRDD